MTRPKADREGYGEKKDRVNITLTPTAQRLLDQQASVLGVSRSELIEQIARGLLGSYPQAKVLGEFCAN
ncbi:MAG TPA: hypothetical protein DDW76_34380 [Cyanobacteria bacterium UBA11369]|nr:hypothetical protein [Cyanobacteria bacterium UBA11371]HBE31924.1 hypothetical protein [Cyanobacteria bacterium UBA11368]HBE53703.1 hypothetical protein [Cyanobacteria bacterium UBA11369]